MDHPLTKRRRAAGFTLIEIMVVIAIIGLIATIVVPGVMNRLAEGKITTTKAKMTNLQQQIKMYSMKHNRVPDTLEELMQEDEMNLGDAWVDDPTLLMDAWDHDFVYQRIDNRKYELISLGGDGVEGGENEDADISSDKKKMVGNN